MASGGTGVNNHTVRDGAAAFKPRLWTYAAATRPYRTEGGMFPAHAKPLTVIGVIKAPGQQRADLPEE